MQVPGLASFSLSGRIALVTGGGGGLGGNMAVALASAGADVALFDLVPEGMEGVAAEVRGLGRQCVPITGDLRQLADITRMVATARESFGRLDIAVNCAGINIRKPALDYSEEEWDAIIDVNLKGLFFCCQAEARAMLAAGRGKIINVTSLNSEIGLRHRSVYAGSKGGVTSLTRAMAAEWGPQNVSVNCIGPGQMLTPLTRELFLESEDGPQILARIPAGRFGDGHDLAGAVIFLASDASDYILGQTIYVDGGWLLNGY